jgi:hypothetical protein
MQKDRQQHDQQLSNASEDKNAEYTPQIVRAKRQTEHQLDAFLLIQ